MRKYKLKEIRGLIACGLAKDATNYTNEQIGKLKIEKIGYSTGVYGINGGLFQDTQSGEFYAITARTAALFIVF